MKSMDDLKRILPHAKETLKISGMFEAILKEREKTKQPRLVYLEKCLLSIKEQMEPATIAGKDTLVFSYPPIDKQMDETTLLMELQSLLHDAGYSANIYPHKQEMIVSLKKRY